MKAENRIVTKIAGAEEACEQIASTTTREALCKLLQMADDLKLNPRIAPLGRETAFSFGRTRYPLCRVNQTKGIAFHANREAAAWIIHSSTDDTFTMAERNLKRVGLREAAEA